MLYELIAVVRPGKLLDVKEIARSAGTLVLRSGGVVRGYTNWGTFLLPRPTRVHQMKHTEGHYFIMRFDSRGGAQTELRRVLGLDPRMIRFSVVRLGKTLDEIAKVEGQARWQGVDANKIDHVAELNRFKDSMHQKARLGGPAGSLGLF